MTNARAPHADPTVAITTQAAAITARAMGAGPAARATRPLVIATTTTASTELRALAAPRITRAGVSRDTPEHYAKTDLVYRSICISLSYNLVCL